MIRTILLIAACATLAACETTVASPDGVAGPDGAAGPVGPSGPASMPDEIECDESSKGKTKPDGKIKVTFGASSISVTPKIKADSGTYFTVTLKPKKNELDAEDGSSVDYANLNVYFFGSTPEATWLNKIYNAEGNEEKTFDVCAKAEKGVYKYSVVVPGVGTIDPRIDIN